jgi:hypothetical protein
MDIRALARLVIVSVSVSGVFVVTGHLDPAPADPTAPNEAAQTSFGGITAAPTVTRSRALTSRASFEQPLPGPRASSRPDPRTLAPIDDTRRHTHLPDPETGGPVPIGGATGVVGDVAELGPVHTDPMPPGVTLSDPTDTDTLLDRASVQQPRLASSEPFAAGASSPVGTPGIAALSRHLAPSCSGTGVDGNRVQVLYVHESATRSRFTQVLPILRNEIANVDDVFGVSAEQTGGQRRVRWVHGADCQPVVKDVTVPNGALGTDFWATIAAVKKLGYQDPHRKYLMFADANRICGIGTLYDDPRPTNNPNDGSNASYSRVDAGCWSSSHSVPAHELTHNLGGVLHTAPHGTVNGHCFDESDLMCYDDGSGKAMVKVCASAQEQLLDCHHDDYFNTKPAAGSFLDKNWNTARSSFLDAVVAPVTGPAVALRASATAVRTGQVVALTATSPRTVSWTWSRSAAGSSCTLTVGTPGRADLRCPSTVSGTVTVTATATEAGTAARGAGQVSMQVTRASAPVVRVSAPTTARAGVPFAVSASATGMAPFRYSWVGGTCPTASPASGWTTVTCAATAATRRVTVMVVLTQADGQLVRSSALVQVAR